MPFHFNLPIRLFLGDVVSDDAWPALPYPTAFCKAASGWTEWKRKTHLYNLDHADPPLPPLVTPTDSSRPLQT